MRYALISVAPPFRGGISLQTALLFNQLSKEHEIVCYNYSRQYPNILFPGKTQYETGKVSVNIPSHRTIDSVNPISWYKTAKEICQYKADVAVFRFWNPFFAPALGKIARRVKRLESSIKCISICDNIFPHESRFFDSSLIRYFLSVMDSHIIMANSVEQDLKELIVAPKYKCLFHPVQDASGDPIEKMDARKKLKISQKHVILYFGYVRKYKGLDVLIQATRKLKDKLNDFLVLAVGESYEGSEKYEKLIRENGVKDHFKWINEYVPDEKVNLYFSASDVVALPYHSATQSGVVPMAYRFDRPVIVTKVGGLEETVEEGVSGFLIDPGSYNQLADCLFMNLKSGQFRQMTKTVAVHKNNFSWSKFTDELELLARS